MEPAHQYLLEYLEEEFSRYPQVRVRIVPHKEAAGVTVRTEAREYFFPAQWAEIKAFNQVERLVARIKNLLGGS
jgi:hypothetical protein